MYVLALATDYDGTLAHDGIVSDEALAALERLAASGRKLILVTGRELPDLEKVFARIDIFDRVVAENGALLYTPASRTERELAPKPSPELVKRLSARGVAPISVGRSVIATWEPHEAAALEEIKRLGLELEIIFNKGAVMILPSGVNKASGLAAALEELQLSPHNVVGVGDAENDHAFLRTVGFGVAVSNALPQVKKTADFVTERARGDGVIELAEHLLEEDAGLFATERHRIQVGRQAEGAAVTVSPSGGSILLSGTSGIGKSTLATAMMERFAEQKFQFCVIDPEGDYEELEDVVTVGDGKTAPSTQQILDLLAKPSSNVVINLLGIKIDERPNYFAKLMPDLASLRARTGRPHWLIIDEAHHLLPTARDGASLAVPQALPATILITVHPDLVSPDVLAGVRYGDRAGSQGRRGDHHLLQHPQGAAAQGQSSAGGRQGAVLGPHRQRRQGLRDRGRAAAAGAQAAPAQICGRRSQGPQLLLHRRGWKAEPQGAEPDDVRASRRRYRR